METTGIGSVCYSNNMENENIEGLKRDINVLKRQRRRQTELNTVVLPKWRETKGDRYGEKGEKT